MNALSGRADNPAQPEINQSTAPAGSSAGAGPGMEPLPVVSEKSSTANKPAGTPIDRRPEHLRIETWEQSFMKLLHELIPTPRAGKPADYL